ncbi:hypothetical protein SADUNF_Sadunf02G0044600 [Salix dunnii]|uniref:Cyclin n=1 Tax=Salix dunnii TaxID=1413687 RepID=A0A835N621_9ROSI|nr:hypothetical protein SADUNF_Sadunf02G0044600 [Salix dunnii]
MNQDSQYSLFLSSVLSEPASFLTLLWFDREASPQESWTLSVPSSYFPPLCFYHSICELMGFNSMQLISDMEALSPDTGSTELEIYQTLGLKESRKGVFKTPRVLMLLSSLLERSVQKNEILMEKTQSKDVVTIFHGLRPPPVSIRQYVDRIFKYSACSPSCFVVAHVYVDRFLQQTDIHLTSLNVHRLLITSVMIAAKFVDDATKMIKCSHLSLRFFNNGYYARVGGVSTEELNRLEMKFLFGIDFRLQVNVNTFGKYCYRLEKESSDGLQIERAIQTCRIKESWSNKDDSTTCASTIAMK